MPTKKGRRYKGEKFQGREITATIQAPDEADLDMMLQEMQDYTAATGLEPIEVLSKGPDPDGGYRAVIVAHNWNPLAWLKKKVEERGGGPEARAAVTAKQREYAQKVRIARLEATGKERVKTEAELAAEEEKRRREKLLRKLRPVPIAPATVAPTAVSEEDIVKFILS